MGARFALLLIAKDQEIGGGNNNTLDQDFNESCVHGPHHQMWP